MRSNPFVQLLILLVIFLVIWLGLSSIDYVGKFDLKEADDKMEEKLGELILKDLTNRSTTIKDSLIVKAMDDILYAICKPNNIDTQDLKLFILDNTEINAFALPDDKMIVYTGLIDFVEEPEELAGVIAHELGHITNNHINKKLAKELGIGVLLTLTGGNSSGQLIGEVIRTLSGTAYDRSLESEADALAVQYLIEAKIDPEPLANFLFKIDLEQPESIGNLSWMSTHPEPRERAEKVIELGKAEEVEYEALIEGLEWKKIKEKVKSNFD